MNTSKIKEVFPLGEFERMLDKGHWQLATFGAGKPKDIRRVEVRAPEGGVAELTLEIEGGFVCGPIHSVMIDRDVENELVVTIRQNGDLYRFRLVRSEDAPPGWPIAHAKPYGPVDMRDRQQNGEYFLRSIYGAQPRVLRKGDVLATGQVVCDAPRDAGDGENILINLDDVWKSVPAWAPLGFTTMQASPYVDDDYWQLAKCLKRHQRRHQKRQPEK